jgi:hypothetical protein
MTSKRTYERAAWRIRRMIETLDSGAHRTYPVHEVIQTFAIAIADDYAAETPRFNHERFYEACGLNGIPAAPETALELDEMPTLASVIATLEGQPCTFWACEGPDMPFQNMQTCGVCASVQDLRKIMEAQS